MKNRDYIEYAGFIITLVLSVVLSVLLFTSVAENRLSWVLLMGIAVALELGKLVSIHDQSRLLAGLLIVVSVFGSAGGLSRAMAVSDQQFIRIDAQRQGLLAEIEQNNQAIDRYLQLDRIQSGAKPLQQRNESLRQQLAELPRAEVSELGSLIQLLADFLSLPVDWVRASVILLLACLLDALMVNFIRSGMFNRINTPEFDDDPDRATLDDPDLDHTVVGAEPVTTPGNHKPVNVEAMADSYPAFRRMMLSEKELGNQVPSQRSCIRDIGIRERLVRQYFQRLVKEGLVEKIGQKYRWRQAAGSEMIRLK